MANKAPPRSVLKMILTNFMNSFKPRQTTGTYIGEDYFGNKYYEIAARPDLGKRKPSRYFQPANKDDFDQELSAEWEAWLRGRRIEPPSREELIKNLSIMEMKKSNAHKLDKQYEKPKDDQQIVTGLRPFPQHKEYENTPGWDTKEETNNRDDNNSNSKK